MPSRCIFVSYFSGSILWRPALVVNLPRTTQTGSTSELLPSSVIFISVLTKVSRHSEICTATRSVVVLLPAITDKLLEDASDSVSNNSKTWGLFVKGKMGMLRFLKLSNSTCNPCMPYYAILSSISSNCSICISSIHTPIYIRNAPTYDVSFQWTSFDL